MRTNMDERLMIYGILAHLTVVRPIVSCPGSARGRIAQTFPERPVQRALRRPRRLNAHRGGMPMLRGDW